MDAFRRFLLSPITLLNINNSKVKGGKQIKLKIFETRSVKILNSPNCFYTELRKQVKSAKRHVSLASLYLGISDKEIVLRDDLCKLIESNKNIQMRILVDKNRGTRPDRETGASTASLCTTLLHAARNNQATNCNKGNNDTNVNINFFEMPRSPDASKLRIFVESFLPPRFNEMFQTFHMKAYVFDDTVILSGANLSTDYFTNRQDRYIVIDCPQLASFYHKMIEILGKYSYSLTLPLVDQDDAGMEKQDDKNKISFALVDNMKKNEKNTINLKRELEDLIYVQEIDDLRNYENTTTICAPTIQFKSIGIDHDEQVTCSFLSNVPTNKDRLNVASGYLNFTDTYTNLMATSGASIHAMTASPKANGFYTANGVSGSLPLAYSLLEQQFIETFNKTRTDTKINMHEYGREGWTFHGKGMWFIPGGNVNEKQSIKAPTGTIIGSPNYGWRSVLRDSESQIYLHTYDHELQQDLYNEWNLMEKDANIVHEDIFKEPGRFTREFFNWKEGHWINIGARLVKTFM